jgi:hypothetical protein
MHFLGVTAEEKEPGAAAGNEQENDGRGDDQLELALGRGGFFGFRSAIVLIIVCHRVPAPSGNE